MSESIPNSGESRLDPLGAAWRLLAAPQTLMVLMGVLAFVLAISTLLPPVPSLSAADSQGWLSWQSGLLDPQSGLVNALGLDDPLGSPWFHLLLALVGLVLFVRLADSAEFAWLAGQGKPWLPDKLVHWGQHPQHACLNTTRQENEAMSLVRSRLEARGYRWAGVAHEPAQGVAARRVAWLWVRPLVYGGLLIALLGLAIVGTWGWRGQDWSPAPGDSRQVGRGLPYEIQLTAFQLDAIEDGRALGLESEIGWFSGPDMGRQDTLGVGRPARFHGITVRQVGYVPAVQIRAWDQDESLLALQVAGTDTAIPGQVGVVFSSLDAQPLLFVPEQDRFLALSFTPKCAAGTPMLRVDALDNGGAERNRIGALAENGSLTGEGLRLDVTLDYRPILRLDRRPAMFLVVAGMILALVALAVAWVGAARLVWCVIQPDQQGTSRVDLYAVSEAVGRPWLPRLAEHLEEALADDA